MSERWLTELRKMGRMEPSGNLLDRAESMPFLPEPGPSPAARVRVALIALLLAVAGTWGAFAALNGVGDRHQAAGSEAFSALWPETSLAEAQQVQSRVDAGDPDLQWRTDAGSVALHYGQAVLGWPNPIAGLTTTDDADTVIVSLHGPNASCQGTACEDSPAPQSIMTVTLERLVRSGDGGIWSVTAADG